MDTSIDPAALHQYLTLHGTVAAPRTVLTGVRKLPPATVRVVQPDGGQHDECYWQPSYSRRPEHAGMDAADWSDAVLDSLRTAVRRRTVADVPVGVLLSGGLDSSLIVALLAEAGQDDQATFSVGFEAERGEQGDEFMYSDLVAREFATDHHQIMVPSDRVRGALDRAVAAMSEPMVSHDVVAFHLLSEQVSKHVTVVQSGQGADEIFAGYRWHPALAAVSREREPETFAKVFFDRSHADLARILEPELLADHDAAGELVRARMAPAGAETALDAAIRLDTHVLMVDDPVKRVDNMTMDWGLEARVPFLDHELVELAAACPPQFKLAHGGKGSSRTRPASCCRTRSSTGPRATSRYRRSAGWPRRCSPGSSRPWRPPRPGPGGSSRRRTWPSCWPHRTPIARRAGRTPCGRWPCWRCGCSPTGSTEREADRGGPAFRPRGLAAGGPLAVVLPDAHDTREGHSPVTAHGCWYPSADPTGVRWPSSATAAAYRSCGPDRPTATTCTSWTPGSTR